MEKNGFAIDVEFCSAQAATATGDEQRSLSRLGLWLAERGIPPLPGADAIWSSPKQLSALLHDHLRYPPSPIWKKGRVKLHKGERKCDETALNWIRSRIEPQHRWGIDELIRLRRIRGCLKYLTKLPTFIAPDGLVHPVCGPAGDDDDRSGTLTGRIGAKNPEVMQIPQNKAKDWYRIRRAFIAPPGHVLVGGDYASLEVVVMAHLLQVLFKDSQLAEMVDPSAPNIHSYNARRVFQFLGWKVDGKPVGDFAYEDFESHEQCKRLRQMIKEIWFGLAYGKGAFGFATSLRDENDEPIGEQRAQELVDALLNSVPGIRRFHAWVWDFINRYKGIVGIGGRWCDLKELIDGDEWQKKRAHRIAQNFPMQEGGAAIVGAAMVALHKDEGLRSKGLRLERQIHDELGFRVPRENAEGVVADIERHMVTAFPLTVPLRAKMGIGANWEELK